MTLIYCPKQNYCRLFEEFVEDTVCMHWIGGECKSGDEEHLKEMARRLRVESWGCDYKRTLMGVIKYVIRL